MSSALRNGTPKVRKNLADQIDRLDNTLDGLADNLNQAVASAVKEAVQNVLVEVLTNPELTSLIRSAASPSPKDQDKPSGSPDPDKSQPGQKGFFGRLWDRTRQAARAISGSLAHGANKVVQTVNRGVQRVGSGLVWLCQGVK